MDMDTMAVDISTYHVYDFLKDGETKEELLARANKARDDSIALWESYLNDNPNCELFRKYWEADKKKKYELMGYEEFRKRQREFLLKGDPCEITEERWEEMLCVLPPLKWCTINGVEMFCISEMYTGSFTNQYARYKGKCYTKLVDSLDKSTWLHNYLVR